MSVLPPDPVFCLDGNMGHVHSLCFPDNRNKNYTSQVLASNEDGYVYFWSLETNRLQHRQRMGDSVQAVLSLPSDSGGGGGGRLFTQDKAGTVKAWTPENGAHYALTGELRCGGGFCRALLLDGGALLAVAGAREDGSVDLVDTVTMEPVRRLQPTPPDDGSPSPGSLMALQEVEVGGGRYLMGGYESGDVVLWEREAGGKPCARLKLREYVTSLAYDPQTMRAVSGNASNSLQIFTVDRQLQMQLKCELRTTGEGCGVVALRPDRKILAAGGWDGRLRLFSWRSLRLLAVLTEHQGGGGAVTDVQFTPQEVRYWGSPIMAAAGGRDGVVSLWSLYN